MSFHLSWIAVKGPTKEDVLAALSLREAPADEVPDEYTQYDWALAELPSGWMIILAQDFKYPMPKRLAALSTRGTAIACSLDERSMYSVARLYQDGQAVWSVDHDGGTHGALHLDVSGKAPPELAAVRERLNAEQEKAGGDEAETDYIFDVPADLCDALTGYKFDPRRTEDLGFRRLESSKSSGGKFVDWLLGRK